MEKYYIIQNLNGDTHVEELTYEELIDRVNEETSFDYLNSEDLKETSDTNYWNQNILIIKGKIVLPKPVEVIKKLDIE